MRKIFTCSLMALILSVVANTVSAQAAKYIGYWDGRIEVGNKPRFVLLISDDGKGALKTIARSPDQVPDDIPCETTYSQDSGITVTITVAKVTYTAKLANDTTLQGTFSQQGVSLPLSLTKKAAPANLEIVDQTIDQTISSIDQPMSWQSGSSFKALYDDLSAVSATSVFEIKSEITSG